MSCRAHFGTIEAAKAWAMAQFASANTVTIRVVRTRAGWAVTVTKRNTE